MKAIQTTDQLTLQDSPGCFWLFGLFFIAIGSVFVAGPLGLFYNLEEVSVPVRVLTLLLGLAGVGAGVYVIYGAPITQIVFDAQTGVVRLKRRGLFRRETLEHSLSEITAVYVEEDEDSEGDAIYRPTVQLRCGEEIRLSELRMHDRNGCKKTVETVEAFLATWVTG